MPKAQLLLLEFACDDWDTKYYDCDCMMIIDMFIMMLEMMMMVVEVAVVVMMI